MISANASDACCLNHHGSVLKQVLFFFLHIERPGRRLPRVQTTCSRSRWGHQLHIPSLRVRFQIKLVTGICQWGQTSILSTASCRTCERVFACSLCQCLSASPQQRLLPFSGSGNAGVQIRQDVAYFLFRDFMEISPIQCSLAIKTTVVYFILYKACSNI